MNIDDLTIKQAKEIASFFGGGVCNKDSFYNDFVGKYVIVRSRNEGINAGYVKSADETGIVLEKARRIWYHRPLDKKLSWYEGVAQSGISDESKISGEVEMKVIIENYSITICAREAEKSIREAVTHEQN